MSSFYQMATPLTLNADPVSPMHAVTKQYVDTKVTGVVGSRFVTGVIGVGKLPALVGDVTTMPGSNVLSLNNSGVTAGVYNSMAVDSKGRVTSGSYIVPDVDNLNWGVVQNKPTTLSGYGITDVMSTVTAETVGSLSMTEVQSTAPDAIVTKKTVDSGVGAVDMSGVRTGDVVRQPSSVTPAGYLRANGGVVSKTTYTNLYAILGDSFASDSTVGIDGRPWHRQMYNNYDPGTQFNWVTETVANPEIFGTEASPTYYSGDGYMAKNMVYITAGTKLFTAPVNEAGVIQNWSINSYSYDTAVSYNDVIIIKNYMYNFTNATYRRAPIIPDGSIGTWVEVTTDSSYSGVRSDAKAIVIKNYVYLIGGYDGNLGTVYDVYRGTFDENGYVQNGSWIKLSNLPVAVNYHHLLATKSYLYLLGGYQFFGEGARKTVYRSAINTDGTIGVWESQPDLPVTIFLAKIVATAKRVYLFSNQSLSAPINPDGTLGTWTMITSPPNIGFGPQYVITSSRLYFLPYSGGSYCYTNFTGGSNDYRSVIDVINYNRSTHFKLPDYSSKETNGLFYYIKA